MTRWMICAVAFTLAVGVLGAADDKKKPDDPKPAKSADQKPPDWSAYSTADDASGEVFKADDKSLTIRYTRRATRANGNKEQHIDVEYKYADAGLARRKDVPTFFDDKGLKRQPKSEELDKLRKPIGAPGYAIERADVKVGDIVTLKLLRPREISAQKAKPEDLVIKYAIVIGEKIDKKKN